MVKNFTSDGQKQSTPFLNQRWRRGKESLMESAGSSWGSGVESVTKFPANLKKGGKMRIVDGIRVRESG